MTYQYVQSYTDTKLLVIEQNQDWLDFFTSEIPAIGKNVMVLPIDKRMMNGYETNIYAGLIDNINGKKYDLVLIDGPLGSPNFSRSQMIDMIEHDLLAKDFVVLLDDINRAGEQHTAARCVDLLRKKSISFHIGQYAGKKSMLIICSEKYKYLKGL